MIELHINKTCKGFSPKDDWRSYDKETKSFRSLDIAKEWLKEEYGKSKRSAMYRDTKNGTIQCGYVIGFRRLDRYYGNFLEQHWIEFRESKPISVGRSIKGDVN